MTVLEKVQEVHSKATQLFSMEQIESALDHMAKAITDDLKDENPVVLCVMTGGMIPAAHLLVRLNFPLEMDYVHATRYQGETSGGELHWLAKPRTDLNGRTVLVVDDILDGGVTLAAIIAEIEAMGAKTIKTAVLVDKHHKRVAEGVEHADYTGLEVDDHFIYGYGMDYQEYLRNVPGIFVVAPEHE